MVGWKIALLALAALPAAGRAQDQHAAAVCGSSAGHKAAVAKARAKRGSPGVVAIPRVADTQVKIDGHLDEPAWRQAAVLRDFSEYLPGDDRPAEDSTVVLIWSSSTAIYFGIRAYQDPASVRATLAKRDAIDGDDYVQIVLDTFDDRRQALVFGVNPLGVQADGTLTDAPRQSINATSAAVTGAPVLDLSPDYVYESRGRLTPWGYEVEMRIPLKTLRHQGRDPRDWALKIIRVVQARGHQLKWARLLQTRASFPGQGRTLTGLTGLQRGLVMDGTPEVISALTGGAQATTASAAALG